MRKDRAENSQLIVMPKLFRRKVMLVLYEKANNKIKIRNKFKLIHIFLHYVTYSFTSFIITH